MTNIGAWVASQDACVEIKSNNDSVTITYDRSSLTPSLAREGSLIPRRIIHIPRNRNWLFEGDLLSLGNGYSSIGTDTYDSQLATAAYLTFSKQSPRNYPQSISDKFLDILFTIYRSKDLTNQYTSLIKQLLPTYTGFEITFSQDRHFRIMYRLGNDGLIDMADASDGTQTIMVVCAALLAAKPQQGESLTLRRIDTLIIDEPELSLHPQAQKSLFKKLKELSQYIQVVIATHSPYMVEWDVLEKGGTIIRLSHANEVVKVHQLPADSEIPKTSRRRCSNRDVISREILFTDRAVIVEGLDDANILRSFIESENLQYSFEIMGHGADGEGNILKWLNILDALNIKVGALYDANINLSKSPYKEVINRVGVGKIKQISTNDIRDKLQKCICNDNCPGHSIAGLFTEDGKIKSADAKSEITEILQELDGSLQVID